MCEHLTWGTEWGSEGNQQELVLSTTWLLGTELGSSSDAFTYYFTGFYFIIFCNLKLSGLVVFFIIAIFIYPTL